MLQLYHVVVHRPTALGTGINESLAKAVISQALTDYYSPAKEVRRDARSFVTGEYFNTWCLVAGLSSDRIRNLLTNFIQNIPRQKPCRICRKTLYTRHFYVSLESRDGLSGACKECERRREKGRRDKERRK